MWIVGFCVCPCSLGCPWRGWREWFGPSALRFMRPVLFLEKGTFMFLAIEVPGPPHRYLMGHIGGSTCHIPSLQAENAGERAAHT